MLVVPVAAVRADHPAVPTPDIDGPITGGLHDRPHGTTYNDPASFGYVEEEFFISGTARNFARATTGPPTAAYTTRIYVLRPATEERFNGSVVMEWNNVTGQIDASPAWYLSHEHLIREGFAFVGVTAQKAGQEPSPLALKLHDPIRYAPLHHPGDDYSWDIFSQAGQAIRAARDDTMGGYDVERLIAVGQSQSGSRLRDYLAFVDEHARVFDGFAPMTARVPEGSIGTPRVPVVWINSENEADAVHRPDGENFRLWEIAGAPHFSHWGLTNGVASGTRNTFSTAVHKMQVFDRDNAAQYGEHGAPGVCPLNFLPDRYAYNAAIAGLDTWLRGGPAAPSLPRLARDSNGALVRDADGNVEGGLRLPVIDVPIATYTGNNCALFGSTTSFTPLRLAELYESKHHYLDQLDAAIDAAVAERRLLQADAAELHNMASDVSVFLPLP